MMTDAIFPIETERLVLRAHRVEDLEEASKMWADPIVTRYIGAKPFTKQEAWTKILRYLGHWRLMGFGYWAIEEKSTGNFIGELGFADFKRDMQPSLEDVPELGWALTSAVHGKGFAKEGLSAVVRWGDQHLKAKRTVCIINPDNGASIRLAEKFGYKEACRTTYGGSRVVLFERISRNERV